MSNSTIEFKWVADDAFPYPKDLQFYCTGYTGEDGSENMFSIVVRLIDFDGEAKLVSKAEVFALAEDMEELLPKKGEKFYLTSGDKIVAKGIATERTF